MNIEQEGGTAWQLDFGARPVAGGVSFRVWAPRAERLAVRVAGDSPRTINMERREGDIFGAIVPEAGPGTDYFYVIDDTRERPDPVSRWQAQGVHGPSRVLDPQAFEWTDRGWKGLPLRDYVIYELHTGTLTAEGTFEAIIPKLPHLTRLGVTAVELMPVAEFPGGRNWGYDGTYLYAPQSTYGGPEGLKKLVDACHREGLAVVLDVVYNHFGPEGNYFGEYAPVFSQHYRTPWGDALNFDGPDSDGVRRFFADNARYWLTEYHIDALRLDAIHRIIDISPRHILQEIGEAFHEQAGRLGRQAWLIAESDLNDVRIIKPVAECGYGLDAQWSDDFHHSLHALLTSVERGYFADFGAMADLAKALTEGFVYDGQRSGFRKKSHGTSSKNRPGEQFVICIQNHDQIANSYWGERLASLVSIEQQKLAAALLMLASNLPMLFMGQEWGEVAPFLYFTSHTDPGLGQAVREGRRAEYAAFVEEEGGAARAETGGFADPQSPDTFEQSKLVWRRLGEAPHAGIFEFYRELIDARKRFSCLANCNQELTRVGFDQEQRWMRLERADRDGSRAFLLCNFSPEPRAIPVHSTADDRWQLALWSGDRRYGGAADLSAPPDVLNGASGGSETLTIPGWNAALYVRR